MAGLYKVPNVVDGVLSRGDDKFAVRGGVAQLPDDLAEGVHLVHASEKEKQQYENHADTKRERKSEQDKAINAMIEANEPVLAGTVDTIAEAVSRMDVDSLTSLKRAEQMKRNRKGVLEGIDARIAELAKS